jgi:hypothetical protein
MTEDIAAAFLAIPLTLLFGCLAVFVVSESRRVHDHPEGGERVSRTLDRLSLRNRESMTSADLSGSEGRERSA